MAQQTTLAKLLQARFPNKLQAANVGDLTITITNKPKFNEQHFVVQAAATSKKGYPLFKSDNEALTLNDIHLTLTYNGKSRRSTGFIYGDLYFGGIEFNVTITLSNGLEKFDAQSQLTKPVALTSVLKALYGGKIKRPPGFAKSTCINHAGMTVTLSKAKPPSLSVNGELDTPWTLALANAKPEVGVGFRIETMMVKKKLQLGNAFLEGTLPFGEKSELDLSYCFGSDVNDLDLRMQSGSFISFPDLAGSFGIKFDPAILNTVAGRLPWLELGAFEARVSFKDESITLSGKDVRGDSAFALAEKFEDTWGLAVGIAAAKKWKLGDLTRKLSFGDFVSFDQAFLAVSTHHQLSVDKSVFRALGENVLSLKPGLNFGAIATLNRATANYSPSAKSLHALLGDSSLFLQATIGPTVNDFSIVAAFIGDISVVLRPTGAEKLTLKLEQPSLTFSPANEELAVSGTIAIPVKDGDDTEALDIFGRFSIQGDEVNFAVGAAEEKNKLSLSKAHGVTMEQIGAAIGFNLVEPGVDFQLQGEAWIGSQRSDDQFALQLLLPEFEPTLLYATFSRIDLRSMFKVLCAEGDLPASLKKGIVFEGVKLYMCADPTGTCQLADVQGTKVKTGFGFQATGDIFGFLTYAEVSVEPTSMSGTLLVKNRLEIPEILEMTDAKGKTGPYFILDTTKEEIVASCAFNVLGVSFSSGFDFGPRGFTFGTHFSFQGNKVGLDCSVQASQGIPALYIHGSESIKVSIYGIKVKHIEVTLSTRVKNPMFSVAVQYSIAGISGTKATTISLKQIGHDIHKLGHAIEDALKSL